VAAGACRPELELRFFLKGRVRTRVLIMITNGSSLDKTDDDVERWPWTTSIKVVTGSDKR
jgi:hypothetical protein